MEVKNKIMTPTKAWERIRTTHLSGVEADTCYYWDEDGDERPETTYEEVDCGTIEQNFPDESKVIMQAMQKAKALDIIMKNNTCLDDIKKSKDYLEYIIKMDDINLDPLNEPHVKLSRKNFEFVKKVISSYII